MKHGMTDQQVSGDLSEMSCLFIKIEQFTITKMSFYVNQLEALVLFIVCFSFRYKYTNWHGACNEYKHEDTTI